MNTKDKEILNTFKNTIPLLSRQNKEKLLAFGEKLCLGIYLKNENDLKKKQNKNSKI